MRFLNRSAVALLTVAFLLFIVGIARSQTDQSQAEAVLQICLAQTEAAEGLVQHQIEGKDPVFVNPEAVIRESDIESVEAKKGALGLTSIYIKLTREAGEKMSATTESNLKKPMAILYKGKLVAALSLIHI